MNYASIRTCDIANGEGVRVSLFVSGCTHRCPGCFNKEAQAFDYGLPFTRAIEDAILAALAPTQIAGLSLLGGEPMEPSNQRALVPFLRRFRARYGDAKTLWVYTGCVYEELEGGKVGRWESGKVGKWEGGKAGKWEGGKAGKWEGGKMRGRSGKVDGAEVKGSRWRTEVTDEFLSLTDVLVDGPYIEALKDISLPFRGSSNQRILDLRKARADG